MKKLIVVVLLTAMSLSAQSITKEATAKIAEKDHKALVSYAAGLVKEKSKLERRIAEILKRLQAIDAGEFKAHQIPSGCLNCVTFNNTTSTWLGLDTTAGALSYAITTN